MNNIKIAPMTYNEEYLYQVADERNKALKSLRSNWHTEPIKQKEWVLKMDPDKERYFYIFANLVLIGYCGLDKIDNVNSNAEVSLMIFSEFTGKGYGIKSIKILLDYARHNLHLHSVYIEVHKTTDNWKFWEKCGFKNTGELRCRKYWEGQYYDSIVGSIVFDG